MIAALYGLSVGAVPTQFASAYYLVACINPSLTEIEASTSRTSALCVCCCFIRRRDYGAVTQASRHCVGFFQSAESAGQNPEPSPAHR